VGEAATYLFYNNLPPTLTLPRKVEGDFLDFCKNLNGFAFSGMTGFILKKHLKLGATGQRSKNKDHLLQSTA